MRYTRFKTIVTKLSDDIIDDHSEMLNLLDAIKKKEITCSIQLRGHPRHETARIKKISDNRVQWTIIIRGTTVEIGSSIDNIELIEVNVSNEKIAKLKPEPSRFGILDV